jgi:rSAM/selenodomain-associated transferase 1
MSRQALLTMAKRPAPGQTKTRLTLALSSVEAAALYECFLQDTLALMRQVCVDTRSIAYAPATEKSYFVDLAPDFELWLQQGRDLGDRLANAFQHYFTACYDHIVIMDSDSPTLPSDSLRQAFAELEQGFDVVLGPCEDGGYYLIGLQAPAPHLLRQVPMSTPTVLADTITLADEAGLTVSLLPAWYDVDDADSLARLRQELRHLPDGVAPHTHQFLQRY